MANDKLTDTELEGVGLLFNDIIDDAKKGEGATGKSAIEDYVDSIIKTASEIRKLLRTN